MQTSVIIVTLNRPDYIQRCIHHLSKQTKRIDEIIVVDASTNDDTLAVIEQFPGISYCTNRNGVGRMTQSRNIGLLRATGDLIAFIDDDAFATESWMEALYTTFERYGNEVGAVGGRVIGDLADPTKAIGKLLTSGEIVGNFGREINKVIEVDHLMGCNMCFRREVLAELGGFREDYPGISGLREDTDMFLRLQRIGYKIIFNPVAAVEHLGAPQVRGRRGDFRYQIYGQRNHLVMLVRNYGISRKFIFYIVKSNLISINSMFRKILSGFSIPLACFIGTVTACAVLLGKFGLQSSPPRRNDTDGNEIRSRLESSGERAATD